MTQKEIKELQKRCYAIGNSKFPLDQFFNDIKINDNPKYNKKAAYEDLKLIVDEIYRLREKQKEKEYTLEEVKKMWEEEGYEIELIKQNNRYEYDIIIETTLRCYAPLRDLDYHKNQRFKRISISSFPTDIFYKANYIDNDEPCYLTTKEHNLITKTIKALKKEEKHDYS